VGTLARRTLRIHHLKLPGKLTGNHPLVGWLNELRDFAQSCRLRGGRGCIVAESPDGATVSVSIGGGGKGWYWPSGEEVYDETKTYSRQQVVFVQPTHALVTTGIDNGGTTVFAVAGLWVCTQATDGTTATMPTWPLPDATDPGNAANYWWLISASQVCT